MSCEINSAYKKTKELLINCDNENTSDRILSTFLIGDREVELSIYYDIKVGNAVDIEYDGIEVKQRHSFGFDVKESYKKKEKIFGAIISDRIESSMHFKFDDKETIESLVKSKENLIFVSNVILLLLEDDEVKEILYRRGIDGIKYVFGE